MNKKRIFWSALVALAAFLILLWSWWPRFHQTNEAVSKHRQPPSSVQVRKYKTDESKEIASTPLKEPLGEKEDSEYQVFMNEIKKLEQEHHQMMSECHDNIKGKLQDLNYIDPRSDFYQDMDRLDDLLHTVLASMATTGPAIEMTWLIEDYLLGRNPQKVRSLLEKYHNLQETCLSPSGVTFFQTAIEACSYHCPPRLKGLIGNILFDGIAFLMGSFLGPQRLMLALSLMEKANRFGPYHLSASGEIEDLRFRVQRNYELYQEELQQNQEKWARTIQAFNRYIEENKYLKKEILELLEKSSLRYSH